MRTAIVVLLTLLGVSGCTSGGDEQQDVRPTSSAPPTSTGSTAGSTAAPPTAERPDRPRRRLVRVPDVTGRTLVRAVGVLRHELFDHYWKLESGGACGAPPRVTGQDPAPGPRRGKGYVGLTVAVGRCPLTADLRSVADSFVDFARGGSAPVTTDPVLLMVGHEVVNVLASDRVGSAAAWSGCPASTFYAARVCPFTFLDPFERGPVRVDTAPPAHPCQAESRLPPAGLAELRTVTVTHEGDCTAHATVQLYVDEAGRVVAADLTMPEP